MSHNSFPFSIMKYWYLKDKNNNNTTENEELMFEIKII